jgi:PAS domain S-box-containing protein
LDGTLAVDYCIPGSWRALCGRHLFVWWIILLDVAASHVLVVGNEPDGQVIQDVIPEPVSVVGELADCLSGVSEAPRCVILDIDELAVFPIAAIESLREQSSDVPIVVVGDSLGPEQANEALAAGADQFLLGAIDEQPAELETRVRRVLDGTDAETVLAAELEQYEAIVETIPEGVFVFDADATIVDANQRAAELYGTDRDDVLGMPAMDLVYEGPIERDVLDRYDETVRSLLSSETDVEQDRYQNRVSLPDGTTRVYENRIALRPYDDRFRGTIGVIRDVTDRCERLAELERAKTIIDALPDVVWAARRNGQFIYWNDLAVELLGLESAPDEESVTVMDLVPDDQLVWLYEEIEVMVTADESDVATVEHELLTFDGRSIPVRAHIAPMYEGGTYIGTAGVSRDITEQQRRKQRLGILTRVLQHNLQTDIERIAAVADGIEASLEDPEQAGHARTIREIAEDLAELARNAGRLEDAIETDVSSDATVDLVEFVSGVVHTIETTHEAVEIDCDYPGSCQVRGTEDLSMAIFEILENAVEHNESASPSIDVSVTVTDDTATVCVRDNGTGIPAQERSIITEDADVTELTHGSGLGLWIVKWVVEQSNGEIEITNRGTSGTEVCLRFQTA